MNPCRCGWRGNPTHRCTCSDRDVERYVEKISGPLLDRIDLHVNVPSVEYDAIRRRQPAKSSAAVRERVCAARAVQARRFQGTDTVSYTHLGIEDEDVHIVAGGQDVVHAAEADVVSPAVAAEDPDGLLGQVGDVYKRQLQ